MNIWHDISASRITPEDFIACIEISKGGKNKYELDKETGMLILDRVLNFIAHCHKIFSPSLPWPCISCGAQPCLGTDTFSCPLFAAARNPGCPHFFLHTKTAPSTGLQKGLNLPDGLQTGKPE